MKHAWQIMLEVSNLLAKITPEDMNGIEWNRHRDEVAKMREKANEIVGHVTGMPHNKPFISKSMQKRLDAVRPPVQDHAKEVLENISDIDR